MCTKVEDLPQELVDFLVEHGALVAYMRNFDAGGLWNSFEHMTHHEPTSWFLWRAFKWDDTWEGHDFWSKLDDLWVENIRG